MTIVSKHKAEHYVWGDGCDGWHLLKDRNLSVIHERVPAGKTEVLHRHMVSQQFFFVQAGVVAIEVNGLENIIRAGEGMHVAAGAAHQIENKSADDVEFLVISQPAISGDRENL